MLSPRWSEVEDDASAGETPGKRDGIGAVVAAGAIDDVVGIDPVGRRVVRCDDDQRVAVGAVAAGPVDSGAARADAAATRVEIAGVGLIIGRAFDEELDLREEGA